MSGEWGMADIKARIAALQALITGTDLEEGDGIEIVGEEIRLDIDSLPMAGN
jgi:hypothetical protein